MDLAVLDTLTFGTLDAAREAHAAALWALHEAGDDNGWLDELTPADLDGWDARVLAWRGAMALHVARLNTIIACALYPALARHVDIINARARFTPGEKRIARAWQHNIDKMNAGLYPVEWRM